jgi:DNA (cytosine-5)-methyltransferase 1
MISGITCIDNFCGAGGSTTGLKAAGIEVTHAANHWARAIETHNTNHPEVDHSCVDLHQERPFNFPRTTVAWFSPSCTHHSPSGGRKRKNRNQLNLLLDQKQPDPAAERSRMTAWQVVDFAEYHRYEAVMVENVVEFALDWELYDNWLAAMDKLGYNHQEIYFNSMFAGVPQSRDRIYIVFWRKGNRAPNLNFCPPARCREHGEIFAVQAWKNPMKRRGKYGKRNQYIYVCPQCGVEVVPYRRPAREAIDWSIPTVRIGDRAARGLRPLSENTLRRIRVGLERLVVPYLVHQGHWSEPGRVYTTDSPMPTQTTKREMAIAMPPFFVHRGYSTDPQYDRVPSVDEPSPTQTTSAKLYIAQPFIDAGRTWNVPTSVDEPTHTVLSGGPQMSLLQPGAFLDVARANTLPTDIQDPSATVTTGRNLSLIEPPAFMVQNGHFEEGRERSVSIDLPAPTQTTWRGNAITTVPFLAAYHGGRDAVQSCDEPAWTIATNNQFGVVESTPDPFLCNYNGNGGAAEVSQPSPTMRTTQGHCLVEPNWNALVEECGYRMLQAHEAKWLMGFPVDYILLGTQEEQFKQAGNAVTPPVAEMIGRAVFESLAS